MKKPEKQLIHLIAIIGFLVLIMGSCKKDNTNPVNQTNGKTTAQFNSDLKYGTMTDQDGNVYKTITIGTQTWMAENLRTTKYRNGDPIKNVTRDVDWTNLTTGAYCSYDNTQNINIIATRGLLYNYYAVSDKRNIAPKGWHVPTDEEWEILINYLGGDSIAGGKMKEQGTIHWLNENIGATNESGFTSLPSGWRNYYDGVFGSIDYDAFYWSSTKYDDTYVRYRFLNNKLISVGNFSWSLGQKNSGFSVRCIKDL